jgi:hypothetical protein
MRYTLKTLALLPLISTLGALLPLHDGHAQKNEPLVAIRVRVEAKPPPVKATGIVFSSSTSQEFPDATITKIGDNLFEVGFSVPRLALREDSVASAIAIDEAGQPSFANVTPALIAESRDLVGSIPECPGEDGARYAKVTTPGTIQQLVDVRTERMKIVRLKIARALDETFLKKLQKFEEAFGLRYPTELSSELPPQELLERLSRIDQATRKYKIFTGKPS